METRVKFPWHISGHKNITKLQIKTSDTSNTKHWNKWQLYIHLTKMNKNRTIVFQPTYSSSESRVARAHLSSSGYKMGTNPGQNTILLKSIFTHSHWENLDIPVHLTCPSLGCGRKLEPPRKNPCRRREQVQTAQTGPDWESVFFHWHHNKMTLNKWTKHYTRVC